MIQIAVFYKRQSKNDRVYYQGKLGSGRLLLFKNDKKESEKHPDLILYIVPENQKQEQRDQGESESERDIPF